MEFNGGNNDQDLMRAIAELEMPTPTGTNEENTETQQEQNAEGQQGEMAELVATNQPTGTEVAVDATVQGGAGTPNEEINFDEYGVKQPTQQEQPNTQTQQGGVPQQEYLDLQNKLAEYQELNDFINKEPMLKEIIRVRKEGGDLQQLLPNLSSLDNLSDNDILRMDFENRGYKKEDVDDLLSSFDGESDYQKRKEIIDAKARLKQSNEDKLKNFSTPAQEQNKSRNTYLESLQGVPNEIQSLTGKNFYGIQLDQNSIESATNIANQLNNYLVNPDGTANVKGISKISLALATLQNLPTMLQKAKGDGQYQGSREVFNQVANPSMETGSGNVATKEPTVDEYVVNSMGSQIPQF